MIKTIRISGEIFKSNLADYRSQLDAALDDPSVKVIRFHINSHGGYGGPGSDDLSNKIFESRSRKLIIAIAAGWCTSAAYLIAAACQEILSTSAAHIGGVGVIVDYDAPLPVSPPAATKMTQVEKMCLAKISTKGLDEFLRESTENFIHAVARFRALPIEHVRRLATEKAIYSATDSLRLGLIDLIL